MNKTVSHLCFTFGLLLMPMVVGGCTQDGDAGQSKRIDAAWGSEIFAQKCAACHGADAKGGGPASLGLGVVPPDLTTLSTGNDGVFPRDRVMSVIDGYFRRHHYADPMPTFGDDDLGPLIYEERDGFSSPVPAQLLALANYLESVQEAP